MNSKSEFITHLAELRKRLFLSLLVFIALFAACYFFSQEIYQIILQPLKDSYSNIIERRIIYTNPAEAFLTYLKLSFFGALFIGFPFFLLQIYLFISPALYKKEKKLALMISFFMPLLFLAGAIISYKFVFPLCFKFFLTFENFNIDGINIEMEAKISEYLSLFMHLILGFSLAFQAPLMLVFLLKKNIVSVDSLKRKRKYWILVIFIISAILTPPDIITQVIMSAFMIAIFESIIWIISKKKKNN
jgi:sec-independent protein translocase protein TatC